MRSVLVATAITVPLLAGAAEARECYQRFASGLVQSNIADIQDQLTRHGYAPGPATGLVDKATCRAVLAYQRDARLDETGILDPMLQNQLHFGTPFIRAPDSVDPAGPSGPAADLAPEAQDAPDATAELPDEPRGAPPPRPPVLITPEPAPSLSLAPAAPGTDGTLRSDSLVPYPPPPPLPQAAPAPAPAARPAPAANPDDEIHT